MATELSILEVEKSCTFLESKRLIKFPRMYDRNKNKDNLPIKKPSTIATDMQTLGIELSRYICDHSHDHVQGRGKDLKATERYKYVMTDLVHSVFRVATFQVRATLFAARIRPVQSMAGTPESAEVL